ncbi:hypothetical protein BZA05DRAFT_187187 [Tricharina praecox]|uniref:uncharacterized protein n=1 Tax=Tricharina praecox TaxID=43433 RepID=UPI00222128BE|nr:uncharacterized protein BZA05DRAFT_187187 [Tricharina praecox]KAI5843173.1 hypothetical protein BZA05DRAFT_187187 [Tricharina praecox]
MDSRPSPPPNSTQGPAPQDYGHGLSRSLVTTAYAVSILLFVIGTISIILRIYSRAVVVRLFGLDDWLMTSILVFHSGQHAILMLFLHYGAGLHNSVLMETDPGSLAVLPKVLLAEQFYYAFMQFIIKMCILAFYLRLSPLQTFRRAVYGTMALNTVCTVVIWLVYCLQCIPLKGFWAPTVKAKCLPPLFLNFFPASLNIATDVVIFILPLPTLFKLQTSLRRRVAVMSIMSVGGISLIVSCLRLIVLHQFAADLDFAYLLGKMVIMSAAELETMIVAANIPSYKALWVHGLGWKVFWGSTRNESTGGAQKLSGYELTHHSRLRAPTKEIGIDTEIGLHDSQEELCKNEAAAARAGGIQVSRDFTVTSDRCGERDAAKLDKERNRAYYDVGNS